MFLNYIGNILALLLIAVLFIFLFDFTPFFYLIEPFIVVSEPIWYIERGGLKCSLITSSALSLMIKCCLNALVAFHLCL